MINKPPLRVAKKGTKNDTRQGSQNDAQNETKKGTKNDIKNGPQISPHKWTAQAETAPRRGRGGGFQMSCSFVGGYLGSIFDIIFGTLFGFILGIILAALSGVIFGTFFGYPKGGFINQEWRLFLIYC